MDQSASLFDHYFSKKRPWWLTLIVCLTLLLLPFVAAFIDGNIEIYLSPRIWRIYLLAPTIIIYIWLVSPLMARTGDQVIDAIRILVDLDSAEYDQIVHNVSRIKPAHEWLAFGIGILVSVLANITTDFDQGFTWLTFYWIVSTCLMYGILAWTIFVSIASTRVNTALHRVPMHIDILNPNQFETVGRQSLLLALVFIGGFTLSLLFTFHEGSLTSPEFWISNILFVLFTILIFFLSMRPTHRLLAKEKENELEPIQSRINHKCRELAFHLDQIGETGVLSAEINALAVYEERLLAARTWPYNLTMLRTLFFSVFIPLGSILARLTVDILLP
jgi:hypothetical protein